MMYRTVQYSSSYGVRTVLFYTFKYKPKLLRFLIIIIFFDVVILLNLLYNVM